MKSLGICLWCASIGVLFCGLAVRSLADEAASPANSTTSETALCRCAADTSANTRRILDVLSQPLKHRLEFTEEPLEDVSQFLQEEYEIPVLLDEPALENAGITRDEALTVQIENVSLRSALRLLLESKQLVYMIRNEVLFITTPDEADAKLLTCVYDIRDLTSLMTLPDTNGRPVPDYDPLIDSIISCVAPDTWAEAGGGEAEIRPLPPGMLVVSQTRTVHDEIAALLATIRETLQEPVPGSQVQPETAAMGRGMEGLEMGMEGGMMEHPKSAPEPTPAEETPFD